MKLSAEIGHYFSDAYIPLLANSNHYGQLTIQRAIHGFWESLVPQLLAQKEFDQLSTRWHPSDKIIRKKGVTGLSNGQTGRLRSRLSRFI